MRSRTTTALGLLGAFALLLSSSTSAQTLSSDPFESLPTALKEGDDSHDRRQLTFRLIDEIPLPGPLPGGGPRWSGETIEIPVAGGIARLDPTPGAEPRLTLADAPQQLAADPQRWVENDRGRLRFSADEAGYVHGEKRCKRCSRGWKKKWKLRVAGVSPAPPLVTGKRVCFGSFDNRAYCVKARNGHRVWVVGVEGRVSQPLVRWMSSSTLVLARRKKTRKGPEESAILATLEQGSELLALSERDGLRIAGMKLRAGEGEIVSVPLATPDGRVVLARQGYADADAALLIYRLVEPLREPAAPDPQPDAEESPDPG